ncbi:PREDICTED: uncharacterized protein LOC104825250 [Tarenaya hassleriana]|uniref:uncharacterized protein LOC104825250 n=1 Tax=Tarenaya hassleriana TaxID=28532 RepID=UPI00053CA5A2|nr:PREDICTED: uncharacterized protein LOC104825250 [Tarenaya hassleriana]
MKYELLMRISKQNQLIRSNLRCDSCNLVSGRCSYCAEVPVSIIEQLVLMSKDHNVEASQQYRGSRIVEFSKDKRRERESKKDAISDFKCSLQFQNPNEGKRHIWRFKKTLVRTNS